MKKNKTTQPVKLSKQALKMLRYLKKAEDSGYPFQPCEQFEGFMKRSLVKKDLVFRSPGVDGTVKYCITSRGKTAIENHARYKSSYDRLKLQVQALEIFFQKHPHTKPLFERVMREMKDAQL